MRTVAVAGISGSTSLFGRRGRVARDAAAPLVVDDAAISLAMDNAAALLVLNDAAAPLVVEIARPAWA